MEESTDLGDKPAFELRTHDGHVYKIWENGKTEGFDTTAPCVAFNRIPILIANARTA